MTDSELLTRWSIGMALAVVVVLVVAALLFVILDAARGVLAAAARCLTAVERTCSNVEPVWDLTTTNDVAARLVQGAQSIGDKTRRLADAVEAHQPAPTRSGA